MQKLFDKTPESVVYFLAGSLPAEALLHLRQLSLFCMICLIPDNILNRIARYILITAKENSTSWFVSISKLCLLYGLPHPLTLLNNPIPKISSKKMIKTKVLEYWQTKLRLSSSKLDSLIYFKPEFMSLNRVHPIWSTCGNNSYEVTMAIVQVRFLSGRYRCEKLTSHFSTGSSSQCSICDDKSIGSIEHILTSCSALHETRSQHLNALSTNMKMSNKSKNLIKSYMSSNENMTVQFLLDASVLPDIITAVQSENIDILDEIFGFTRTWCYAMHRKRLQLQGKWGYY